VRSFPIIKDPERDLSCEDCTGGQLLLHRVPRSPITRPITNPGNDEVLQDEAGFPILDEITGNTIFDTYPHTLVN
jgi:hypothetical protein